MTWVVFLLDYLRFIEAYYKMSAGPALEFFLNLTPGLTPEVSTPLPLIACLRSFYHFDLYAPGF